MTNNKLRVNANKTDFIIIGTSRQHSKVTHFFPTNNLSHSITPSDIVCNLGVTFDSDFNFRKHVSLTCHSYFYHIHDLHRIRCQNHFKRFSKTLVCSELLSYGCHTISSVFPFCPTSEISSLAPCSISQHFQTLHYCLSNSFFWRTFISIFNALFNTEAQRTPFF